MYTHNVCGYNCINIQKIKLKLDIYSRNWDIILSKFDNNSQKCCLFFSELFSLC